MVTESELHTIEDVRAYIRREVQAHMAREARKTRAWNTAKFAAWLLMLLGAFLQFYFLSVLQETVSMQSLRVNVPANRPGENSRT